MQKLTLFLLIFLTTLHCSRQAPMMPEKPGSVSVLQAAAASPILTDCEKFGLKGRVKQWTRESCSIKENAGIAEKRLLNREIRTFNQTGRQLEVKGFNEKAELASVGYTSYNAAGQICEEKYYNGKGMLLVQINYDYDAAGLLIREIKQDFTAGIIYTSRWVYAAGGAVTEFEKTMTSNGREVLQTRVASRYNKKGSITGEQRTEYKGDGSLHFKTDTSYNNSGKVTKQTEYDDRGDIAYRTKYRYDNKGNLLEINEMRKHYETGKLIRTTSTYAYDKNSNLASSREPGRALDYHYDEKGNVLEIAESVEAGRIPVTRTRILYDDHNRKKEEEQTHYSAEGEIAYSYKYTYGGKAEQLAWAKYDAGGRLLYGYRTLYDENGNKTEEVEDSTGRLPRIKYRYAYDSAGNHLETKCYQLDDQDNALLVMTYEYSVVYWN